MLIISQCCYAIVTASSSNVQFCGFASVMSLEGTALPALSTRLHNSPSMLGAYPQILKLEKNIQATYTSADRAKNLVFARILGYLILEGVSDQARVAVALEVNACCGDEAKMLSIGKLYFDHFIRTCKLQNFCFFSPFWKVLPPVRKHKGPTPTPSQHASRPSFETRKAMILAMVVEAPQNHRHAKANVSATDRVISTVCQCPAFFFRP